MNYGFLPMDDSSKRLLQFINLQPEDKNEEFFSNLYHIIISDVQDSITGSNILEIGAGRGGGASFVTRYFNPGKYIGLDYSEAVVKLSNSRHKKVDRLAFQHGNAESIPFPDDSFDIVLNVESSHCYANITKFILEAYRVLKPHGYFLIADFRSNESMNELHQSLKVVQWRESIKAYDITANVFSALDAYDTIRREIIKNATSFHFLRKFIGEFAGVSGGKIYESFRERFTSYHRFVCRK